MPRRMRERAGSAAIPGVCYAGMSLMPHAALMAGLGLRTSASYVVRGLVFCSSSIAKSSGLRLRFDYLAFRVREVAEGEGLGRTRGLTGGLDLADGLASHDRRQCAPPRCAECSRCISP